MVHFQKPNGVYHLNATSANFLERAFKSEFLYLETDTSSITSTIRQIALLFLGETSIQISSANTKRIIQLHASALWASLVSLEQGPLCPTDSDLHRCNRLFQGEISSLLIHFLNVFSKRISHSTATGNAHYKFFNNRRQRRTISTKRLEKTTSGILFSKTKSFLLMVISPLRSSTALICHIC